MSRSILVLLMAVLGVSGCEKSIINRGYDVGTADFEKIVVGTDTPASVATKLGSPSFRSSVLHSNGDYSWYYSSKHMTKLGVLNPQTVRSVTYVITFGNNDVVKSVNQSNYESPVTHEGDTVNTQYGKNKGIIKETFGGMGKYIDMYSKE